VAFAADRALRRAVADDPRWVRTNFRGRAVCLTGGPAVAGAAVVGAAVAGGGVGAVVAGGTAAVFGLYDDLYGDSHARGLGGHLRALRDRRLTTGMVKLVGLAGGGFVAGRCLRGRSLPALADAALVAGAANLVNLFDLRPGRALKVVSAVAASSVPLSGPAGTVAAATAAAALATMPADLAERVMIGDCGANAVGALCGWSLATGLGRTGRTAALVTVVGLTLASERVSFTAVIERTPWLRAVDEWGRLSQSQGSQAPGSGR
jgi:hypothetical protein